MSRNVMTVETPEKLLERLRAGDPEAAGQLFARHRRHLVRIAQSHLDNRLRSRLDASDVVQEALQEATRKLGDYLSNEPMPFALWLRQIVITQVNKAWRHHGAAQQRSVTKEMPYPDRSSLWLVRALPKSGSTPSQHFSKQEQAERVRAGLARLSEVDRSVLEMRYFEEQSYPAIGFLLGVSEDAARKQCVRALLRLSKALREIGSETVEGGDGK